MRTFLALSALFAGLVLLAPFGSQGIGPWVYLMAIIAVPLPRFWSRPPPISWPLLGIVVLGFVSMVWSVHGLENAPWTSYSALEKFTGLKLALLLLGAFALVTSVSAIPDKYVRHINQVMAFSTLVMALILGLEAISQAELYRILTSKIGENYDTAWRLRNVGQGGFVLLLLFWPALHIFRKTDNPKWLIGLVLGTILTSISFDRSAQVLALVMSALVYIIALKAPKFTLRVMCYGFAGWVLIAPWVFQAVVPLIPDAIPTSWAQRVMMWDFVSTKILENSVFGYGLDASRAFTETRVVHGMETPVISLHPHNMPLQIWLELGVMGAILTAIPFALLPKLITHTSTKFTALVIATLAGWFVIANLSFGVWQEWWLMAQAATVVAILCLYRQDSAHG